MLCVWLEDGKLSLRQIEKPQPPDGYALLKVLRAGICNTDLELVKGYYPYTGVLGHECVALVVSGPAELIGKRAVVEINFAGCNNNKCDYCSKGVKTHCRQRTVMGIVNQSGCFAEYVVAPEANLVLVPPSVTDQAACFAEPLAAALEVTKQVEIKSEQEVLIIGDGKLGLLIAMVIMTRDTPPNLLTVVGRHSAHLDILTTQFRGIRTILDQRDAPPKLDRGHYDIAIECTGNGAAFELAVDAVRPRGIVVMKSTYAGNVSLNAAPIVVKELTLIGSRCGPMREAMSLLSSGKLQLNPLVAAEVQLEDAPRGFQKAKESGSLKIQLLMPTTAEPNNAGSP